LIGIAVAAAIAAAPVHDGSRDFGPQIGRWHTELRRLAHPLSGSPAEWIRYSGTTTVTPVWDGKANLAELEVQGPAGHIEGLSMRLYDPTSRQWRLYYSNSRFGTLIGEPTVGQFTNGRGEFYSSDTLDGRSILVRFVIAPESPDTIHFEQSYSADGGRTWEANWIATDTRLR
jgi:hypothetical protein